MDLVNAPTRPGRRACLRHCLQLLLGCQLPRWVRAEAAPAFDPRAWPEASFSAESLSAAIATLTRGEVRQDARLGIEAPALAENGAVVPVKIALAGPAEQVAILVAGNPVPMVARFDLSSAVRGPLATRIKMGETSAITVLALDAEGARRNDRPVEVTVGGCG